MEESLTCSICLQHFNCPVTVLCGHTFCKSCIYKYWNKREEDGHQDGAFNCPVCNKTFVPRPSLNRNVSLASLSEAINSLAERAASMSCSSDVAQSDPEQLCVRHQRTPIFYCRTDRVCVCSACSVNECKEHFKVLVEEERSQREVITPTLLLVPCCFLTLC